MNWVQFCIVMGYASWFMTGSDVLAGAGKVTFIFIGYAWLIAAVIVAVSGIRPASRGGGA